MRSFSGSVSMWKTGTPGDGRLIVGIHGTSESTIRIASASASARFCTGWFQ